MREPTYFVLASLLRGPLHGYAIIKRAGQLSDGRVRLATGTLYTALDRLTADGHVRLVSEETVAGRIRRSYGLTEDGATALRAEAQRGRLDIFRLGKRDCTTPASLREMVKRAKKKIAAAPLLR